jgi:hypothetical protein
MGQFGLNLDEHSGNFGFHESEKLPLTHKDLQQFRARIGEKRERSAILFAVALFVAGFSIGFMLLYVATGLHNYVRASL